MEPLQNLTIEKTETRACQSCRGEFTIAPEDFAFYEKIDVSPPTWCPQCRLQRRLAWRNERGLHQRQCDLCHKPIIALYPAGAPFPVYCTDCWWSDRWDPLEYGREYDFSQDFFTQFRALQNVVPRVALERTNTQNCDFSNQLNDSKNCYLVTSSTGAEDCYYSHRVMYSRDIIDSLVVKNHSERCLGSIEIDSSYNIVFCRNVSKSSDLLFCSDVHGSHDCFMSYNLRQAAYVFRNEQLNNEEYEVRLKQIDLGSAEQLAALRREFAELQRVQIHRFADQLNCQDCAGTALRNCKNCHYCIAGANLEDCRYCLYADDLKDVLDVNNGCCSGQFVYETCTTGVNVYNVKFAIDAWPTVRDITYVDHCGSGSSELFGCIALRGKQYCVLNKQYSKEAYERLVPKITAHMNEQPHRNALGQEFRYGEFFPTELSPFAYNQSVAQEYFPLSREQATERGYMWHNLNRGPVKPDLGGENLPDRVKDVDESYLGRTIQCAHSHGQRDGRLNVNCQHQCTLVYKLIPQELAAHKNLNVALPRLCPNCRHAERLEHLPPYQLWHRQCLCTQSTHDHGSDRCPNHFETSFSPDRPDIVYCEQCYQAEVV